MIKRLPVWEKGSQKDRLQNRLMIIALLIIITYASILTLAPAVRRHSDSSFYQYRHWLGVLLWIIAFGLLHLQSKRKLEKRDPFLIPIAAILSGIGLMTIWRLYPDFGLKQSIWLLISAILATIGMQFPSFLDHLRHYKYLWLILGLILTALTIFLGTNPSGYGPRLWFRISGIYFQPSEPLKLLLIAFIAAYFADRLPVNTHKLTDLLPTIFVNGIAILLLVFQRDLGTATVFLILYLAMLYTTHGNRTVLWVTPVLFLIAGVVGYFFIDIVQFRINTWLSPLNDPSGASYQIIQSWIAIAEGDILGTGPGLGSPSFIPVAISDFIFSAIAEELGFLGAIFILTLIIFFVYRGIKISSSSQSFFSRYLAIGLVFYFGFQSVMIIGGNLGLFPLTGVTLPFVSYGGTSLLFSFLGLLILLNISHQSSASTDSNAIRQPMHHFMSYILIFMLILEVVAVSLLSFWFRPQLVARPENPRWVVDDRFTERGNILDRDNEVIITNRGEIGSFERISNYTPLYPIVGYTNPIYGQTGIELTMYPYLRGYQGYSQSNIFSRELIYNQPPEGLDVRLTIDLDLQKSADEHLGNLSGAVIIMNANSGEILAMASHPYFDAADLSTTWEDLIKDESGPLVNRVTQGTYPPGTALFPFLLSKAYEENLELPSPVELYEKNNRELNCAIPLDGIITWDSFAKQGCLKSQEALATLLGYDNIYESFQRIGLFSEPNLHLDVASATQPESETVMAFFSGSESFRATPLQLGLAASSISNGGILPSPRIVSAYLSPDNVWETIPKLTSNQQVFTEEVAEEISGLLQIPEMPYWQVVATTHLEDDKSISWFVIGTTLDWPGQPAIVVVLLESPDTVRAQEIGLALIQEATNYQLDNEE